jgi:hypothetical protein
MNTKLFSVLLLTGLLLTVCGILAISTNIRIPIGTPSATPTITPLGQVASATPVGAIVPVTGDNGRGLKVILYGLLGLFGVIVFLALFNIMNRNSKSPSNRPRY